MPPRLLIRLSPAGRPVAAACLCLVLVSVGIHLAKYPDFSGFWAGIDQQRYLQSARAWAALDLSPGRHHYLPLYPMLGAAFVRLTPWQPFLVPDAACWVVSLLVFVRIGRRLAPGWPDWASAACFLAGCLWGRTIVAIWVVPWSTTGSAPWQFAAILFAMRFGERPSAARAAALGAVLGVVAGFRPSDAAVLLAVTGSYAAIMVLRHGARAAGTMAIAAGAGLAAGLLPALVAHAAVFGASPGPYVGESASIGFEWRLLPLRWVTLVVDPRPLLPEGRGLAEALPWIVPGIAGLTLGVSRRNAAALLAASAVGLHWASYLAYRDMHPFGLWRFYNVHYFKWTFPFLVLWAAQLAAAILRPSERRRAVAALAATLALFVWRPVLDHPRPLGLLPDARGAVLTGGLPSLSEAALLPVSGSWSALYLGALAVDAGGRQFVAKRDVKLLPMQGGALLVPLRSLPAGPATLILAPGMALTAPLRAVAFRQSIVLGLPCGVWPASCTRPALAVMGR